MLLLKGGAKVWGEFFVWCRCQAAHKVGVFGTVAREGLARDAVVREDHSFCKGGGHRQCLRRSLHIRVGFLHGRGVTAGFGAIVLHVLITSSSAPNNATKNVSTLMASLRLII
jgi:hypothetical protein